MLKPPSVQSDYARQRDWYLHELRRVAACLDVGSMPAASAARERRGLQKQLAKLRRERPQEIEW